MRARFSPTNRASKSFGRLLVLAFAMTVFGQAPRVASALEFTTYQVEEVGYELWLITGTVDAILDIDEHVTIDFGGAIAGESTVTTAGGEFEYYFEAYYGDLITFVASFETEQSETVEWVLHTNDGGPQP